MAGAAQDSFSGRFWRDSFIFDISCVCSIFLLFHFFGGILGIIDDVLVDILVYLWVLDDMFTDTMDLWDTSG